MEHILPSFFLPKYNVDALNKSLKDFLPEFFENSSSFGNAFKACQENPGEYKPWRRIVSQYDERQETCRNSNKLTSSFVAIVIFHPKGCGSTRRDFITNKFSELGILDALNCEVYFTFVSLYFSCWGMSQNRPYRHHLPSRTVLTEQNF